jgi:hypothetical protein
MFQVNVFVGEYKGRKNEAIQKLSSRHGLFNFLTFFETSIFF